MFFLSLALAATFDLNDAGLVLDLPGWEADRWSDWDLRARNPAGPMALELWYTDYQATLTEEEAKKTATIFRSRLEAIEHAKNARMEASSLEEVGGRQTALVTVRFNFDRIGAKGILVGATFVADGRTIHLGLYGPAEAESKLLSARSSILSSLKQTRPPSAIPEGPLKTPFGTITLPAGWREVLPSEAKMATAFATEAHLSGMEGCTQLIQPDSIGNVSLMSLCSQSWMLGPMDADSFGDKEKEVRTRLYGEAGEKVTPGTLFMLSDRPAVLYSLSTRGHAIEVALVPYERSMLMVQAAGKAGNTEGLAESVKSTIRGIAWSGPENGKPAYSFMEELEYGMSYNPYHPVKLLGAVLVVGLVAGVVRSRIKPKQEEQSY